MPFITDLECRKKWKLVRDSYNRCKRKQRRLTSSATPAKNSKWQFFDHLRFLDEAPSQRRSSSDILEKGNLDLPLEVINSGNEDEEKHQILDENTHLDPTPKILTTDTPTQKTSTFTFKNFNKLTKRSIQRKRNEAEVLKFSKERHKLRQLYLQATPTQHGCQHPVDIIFKKY